MKNNTFFYIIFFVMLLLPVLHLAAPGLPNTHDGKDHVVRIANFFASLSEGNLVPRWGNNLNWGFGHPVLMFLYPLPSYTASFFHFLGFSFVDSVKLVFFIFYIASSFCMFFWARKHWGDIPGIIAGLLYAYAPYRFVDMQVRGALGEHAAFLFLPLLLLGIFKTAKEKNGVHAVLFLSCSIAGLLLSHNAVSIMMIPVALAYAYYMFYHESIIQRKMAARLIISLLLGASLSSFFLLPAFIEGKYTLRDIVTKNEVLTRMVPWQSFVYSPWNFGGGSEFTKQIGFIHWMAIAGILVFLKKQWHNKRIVLTLGVLILFFTSLWLMTENSLFIWKHITILQKFQFPWRLLSITVLLSSIAGSIVISQFKDTVGRLSVIVISILLIISTHGMWKPKEYVQYPESFFTSIYEGTTDTGESSPIWSVRFMEFKPQQPLEIAEGNAEIQIVKRTTTQRMYLVHAKQTTTLVENTLYFPGWNIVVNNRNANVEFQNPQWRGRMMFTVPEGTHSVIVQFTDTKLRQFANMISLTGIAVFTVLLLLSRHKMISTLL